MTNSYVQTYTFLSIEDPQLTKQPMKQLLIPIQFIQTFRLILELLYPSAIFRKRGRPRYEPRFHPPSFPPVQECRASRNRERDESKLLHQ